MRNTVKHKSCIKRRRHCSLSFVSFMSVVLVPLYFFCFSIHSGKIGITISIFWQFYSLFVPRTRSLIKIKNQGRHHDDMLQWWQVYGECAVKTAPELNPQRGEAATQGKALTGTSLGDSTEGPKVPRVPDQGSSRAFSAFSCSHNAMSRRRNETIGILPTLW